MQYEMYCVLYFLNSNIAGTDTNYCWKQIILTIQSEMDIIILAADICWADCDSGRAFHDDYSGGNAKWWSSEVGQATAGWSLFLWFHKIQNLNRLMLKRKLWL